MTNRSICVSYSLYGFREIYMQGIFESISSYKHFWPEAVFVCFLGDGISDEVSSALKIIGVRIERMPGEREDPSAMLWRYDAPLVMNAGAYLFRDADSRCSFREAQVVNTWLRSGKDYLIIRDHPHHLQKIMGGLFASRSNVFGEKPAIDMVASHDRAEYGLDQLLLSRRYYQILPDSMIFDSCLRRERHALREPAHDVDYSFMGERVDEFGSPEEKAREALRKFLRNPFRRILWRTIDKLKWHRSQDHPE